MIPTGTQWSGAANGRSPVHHTSSTRTEGDLECGPLGDERRPHRKSRARPRVSTMIACAMVCVGPLVLSVVSCVYLCPSSVEEHGTIIAVIDGDDTRYHATVQFRACHVLMPGEHRRTGTWQSCCVTVQSENGATISTTLEVPQWNAVTAGSSVALEGLRERLGRAFANGVWVSDRIERVIVMGSSQEPAAWRDNRSIHVPAGLRTSWSRYPVAKALDRRVDGMDFATISASYGHRSSAMSAIGVVIAFSIWIALATTATALHRGTRTWVWSYMHSATTAAAKVE